MPDTEPVMGWTTPDTQEFPRLIPQLPWRIGVLDHGYVELVDVMPRDGDLIRAVAAAARVSYELPSDLSPEGIVLRSDRGLVEYLAANGHVSPFSQVELTIRVQCPRFVRDQWYRHYSWKYNEVSARYSEMPELYYMPTADQVREQSPLNKQGRGDLLSAHNVDLALTNLQEIQRRAFNQYRYLLDKLGVAKELARAVLPHGTYTRFQATVSLRDLAFFLRQRLDSHAQWEIRQYARALDVFLIGLDGEMRAILDNYMFSAVNLPGALAQGLREWLAMHLDPEVLTQDERFATVNKRDRKWLLAWLARDE